MSQVPETQVTSAHQQQADAAARRRPWRVFIIACVAVTLVSLDTTIVFSSFPVLRASFPDIPLGVISWCINAYTLVFGALLVPSGRLADKFGRRRMFRLGLAIFLIASILCGLSQRVTFLIAARVLQGIGAALLVPASLALILQAFGPERRMTAIAMWGAVSGLAGALGVSAGGLIASSAGWPWVFYLNLLPGLAALLASASLDESVMPDTYDNIDLVGVALLVAAVACPTLALTRIEHAGWTAGSTAMVAAGAALLGGFVAWSLRHSSPVIDLSLFRVRSFSFVNAATLAFGTAFSVMFFGFFLFLVNVWRLPAAEAGIAVTPGPLLMAVVATVASRRVKELGPLSMVLAGTLMFVVGSALLAISAGPVRDYVSAFLPGLLLTGAGVGLIMPALSGSAMAGLPAARYGVGGAVNQSVRQLGAVIGVAGVVALVGSEPHAGHAYMQAYLLQSSLCVATALLAFLGLRK